MRGLTTVHLRTDIRPEGSIDGRLPNLLVPSTEENKSQDGQLLAAHLIPSWADTQKDPVDPNMEGYRDEAARDESRAWVTLLEGTIHAALVRVLVMQTYRVSFRVLSYSPGPNPPFSKEYCRFLLHPRCLLRGLPMLHRVHPPALPLALLYKRWLLHLRPLLQALDQSYLLLASAFHRVP